MTVKYSREVPNVSRNEALRRLAIAIEERTAAEAECTRLRDEVIASLSAERESYRESWQQGESNLVRVDQRLTYRMREQRRRQQSFLYRLAERWADWRFQNFPTQE